jgi:addiction module HigA family antidote
MRPRVSPDPSTRNGASASAGAKGLNRSKSSIIIDHPVTPDARVRIRTSPSEILSEEFMKPLGLSANALALALRVPANRITGILAGKRAVTADTALRLARYFGNTAQFWMNAQAAFELSETEHEIGATIAKDVNPRAA